MRKIIAAEMMSLDGYFAGPNGEIDWFKGDKEMARNAVIQVSKVDSILLGRVTYELMASYWPSASPSTEDPDLIQKMNDVPKIVFSRTLQKVDWKNTRLISEDIEGEVTELKRRSGKDMVILGSGSIVQAFTRLGLIDEYSLFFHPVVLGRGKPLFKDIKERLSLKYENSQTFGNGVVVLNYQYSGSLQKKDT